MFNDDILITSLLFSCALIRMIFLFSKKGYNVESYGTGSVVTLPGLGPGQPNVYSFDTTYDHMYRDLQEKDPHLYPLRC